jgi:NAD+ synthase (glutamine-hydrolysing)
MQDIVIALVQANVTVGALIPNVQKIVRMAHNAAEAGASIIVFPELVLSGYPPEDLILKKHFLMDCGKLLDRIAREVPQDRIVIAGTPRLVGVNAFNAAAIFYDGKVAAFYHKIALPNYGVFDEKRVFVPGNQTLVLEIGPVRVGVHICEDSWMFDEMPCRSLQPLKPDAVINLSASPFHRGKRSQREKVLGKTAAFLKCPLLYCNLVGGQDELVFDGASFAIGSDGKRLAHAKQFTEDILYVGLPVRRAKRLPLSSADVSVPKIVRFPPLGRTGNSLSKRGENFVPLSPAFGRTHEPALDDLAEVYSALKLGLRDYVDKNGFRKVVVALSGGIDSAIVATIAVDALGGKRVEGITMPSPFTSKGTLRDALRVARNLGIECATVPIRHLQETYLRELTPLWQGRPSDTTEENLQARIRGNIVMALSNKFGWLVLTTGNKSELATGYCTLYGDMVGGFAVIKDVPKTLVFELARWRNRQDTTPVIPPATIQRPPTAELRPNQKDTDSLPPYEILDPILERYIERDWGPDEIVADGFNPEVVKRVARMVDRNEYKRRQGAPGIKITPKAFGRDRRMPITNLYGENPSAAPNRK